jgi:hypothetical protein
MHQATRMLQPAIPFKSGSRCCPPSPPSPPISTNSWHVTCCPLLCFPPYKSRSSRLRHPPQPQPHQQAHGNPIQFLLPPPPPMHPSAHPSSCMNSLPCIGQPSHEFPHQPSLLRLALPIATCLHAERYPHVHAMAVGQEPKVFALTWP